MNAKKTQPKSKKTDTAKDVDLLVAEVESGSRNAVGLAGKIVVAITFCWSLFQLYIASDIPFFIGAKTGLNIVFNNQEGRQLHLAFAFILAMVAYPLFKSSSRSKIPIYDWALAIIAASCCLYLYFNKVAIADRAGLPTTADLIASCTGLICLAIAVYRSLGLPLLIVAATFVAYGLWGDSSWLPEAAQWKGASFGKLMWHLWMQSEGVFGVPLGVSATVIFLFVLFGSILEKSGAANYFIKLAFALLGHLRGGPAKAAVAASAMSGLYSGSSISNVVTTGTFTIPLMKKTGFSPEKAGAVEVASSTNGQLTPPVMGAAAFLISEFTGVALPDLLKHAFLPAIISYIALVYIVHLEALKLGLKGLKRPTPLGTLKQRLGGVLVGFISMGILCGLVYFGLGWIKQVFPAITLPTVMFLFFIGYIALLRHAAKYPDLKVDDPNAPVIKLQRPWEVAVTGLHFLLPIVILIWCILIERLSPTLSAYWATLAMIFISLTQHPLKQFFRGEGNYKAGFKLGWSNFYDGMLAGPRNMISIAVATAAAGIIVGIVTLTGAHQTIGDLVEFLAGGNLLVMLLLVAVMSLILGMGLPTTANYMVVSSLMVPVIVSVGAGLGLIVPVVAVHLFVFYFGILADDTPPVGLAAYAGAAISGGDPIKTGVQGFTYDIRTALLPFLFIFNTELLLIDVSLVKAVFVFIIAVLAMMIFAAATQGYFFAKSKWYESIALVLIAFTLFRPAFWLDYISPPYNDRPASQLMQIAEETPEGESIRLKITGQDFDNPDKLKTTTILVTMPKPAGGEDRLRAKGLEFEQQDDKLTVVEPLPGSEYFQRLQGFEYYGDTPVYVEVLKLKADRIFKEIMYLPAFGLLCIVIMLQRRRQTVPAF